MADDKKEKITGIADFIKKNPEFKEQVGAIKTYYKGMTAQNEAMKSELMASSRILWALIQTKGGQIAVPDTIMAMSNDDSNSIAATYHPEQKATVFVSQSTKLKIIP